MENKKLPELSGDEVVPICDIVKSKQDKSSVSNAEQKKTYLYRTSILQALHKTIEQALSERRISWMNIGKVLLAVTLLIPASFYHWRYYVWAVYLFVTLAGLYAWDYIAYLRHVKSSQRQMEKHTYHNIQFESEYLAKRPDMRDIWAPYVIYVMLASCIMVFFEASDIYSSIYKDSVLKNVIGLDAANASCPAVPDDDFRDATKGALRIIQN